MTNTVSRTVSDETLNAIITIESAGKLNAKAPTSTALGLGQFLNATWLGVVKQHRPDLLEHRTQAQVLALRTVPQLAVELLARFTEDNQRAIGMSCTGGDLYLAHFLGTADAKDLFRADPSTPVSALVSSAVINANRSIMLGKNAGQVRAWAAKRMAQSGGHSWVAQYYTLPTKVASFVDQPPEEAIEDIPDPQAESGHLAPDYTGPQPPPLPPTDPINVQPDTTPYDLDVEILQRKLVKMNYHEIGDADGKWGGKTRGAVAAFMNDRGQPTDGTMTPAVTAEVNKAIGEDWSRPIAPQRANATAKDLAPKVEAVHQSLRQELWAKIAGGFGAIGLTGSTLSSAFDSVRDRFEVVHNYLAKIPPEAYFLAMGIVALLVWYSARRVTQSAVKDFNTGRLN